MRSTRRTQPYRKAYARAPSATLDAMRRGRSAHGFNPADLQRLAQVRRRRKRPRRGVRRSA